MDVMKVKHQLPKRYAFAFNFGFIPNTKAGDGDPVDVLFIQASIALVDRLLNAG